MFMGTLPSSWKVARCIKIKESHGFSDLWEDTKGRLQIFRFYGIWELGNKPKKEKEKNISKLLWIGFYALDSNNLTVLCLVYNDIFEQYYELDM